MKQMRPVQRYVAISTIATMAMAASAVVPVQAADFAGKRFNMVIGMPPAGGVDIYGRLLQRHINKYLQGNPTIVAQNMPGAGSIRALQSLTAAPDDVTTIVTFSSTVIPESILKPDQVKIDFRDYKFIGNISEDVRVCFIRTSYGPSSIADLKAKESVFAATTASQGEAMMVKTLFGLKVRVVSGYAGSADKKLAIEKGEADGDCGGWSAISPNWKSDKVVNFFIRLSPTLLPGMDPAVPYAGDVLGNSPERKIFDFLGSASRLGRPFLVKSKVPADQLAALRAAFDKTMLDPEFLAEAAKMDLSVTPMKGEEVDREIAALYATPADLVARAREIMATGSGG